LRSETDVAVRFAAEYICAMESQIEHVEEAELQSVQNLTSAESDFWADAEECSAMRRERET